MGTKSLTICTLSKSGCVILPTSLCIKHYKSNTYTPHNCPVLEKVYQQQPVGEESPLCELPAADLSCSCRKSYTPAAVLTQKKSRKCISLQDHVNLYQDKTKSQIQSHDIVSLVEAVAYRIVFFVDYAHADMFVESYCSVMLIDIKFYAGFGLRIACRDSITVA